MKIVLLFLTLFTVFFSSPTVDSQGGGAKVAFELCQYLKIAKNVYECQQKIESVHVKPLHLNMFPTSTTPYSYEKYAKRSRRNTDSGSIRTKSEHVAERQQPVTFDGSSIKSPAPVAA